MSELDAAAPIVAVRGEATAEVQPEIAALSVEVSGRDRDKTAALTDLSRRQQLLADALEPFAGAIDRNERSQVSVYATYRNARQDVADVWIASVHSMLTIGDLQAVTDIARAVGAVESATISGPSWAVRPTSEIHRQTRIAAIGEALRRAADYAGAVGARVTALREIADVGMSGGVVPLRAAPVAMMARGGGESFELDLIPQLQTVHAAVEVRVEISAPTIPLDPS